MKTNWGEIQKKVWREVLKKVNSEVRVEVRDEVVIEVDDEVIDEPGIVQSNSTDVRECLVPAGLAYQGEDGKYWLSETAKRSTYVAFVGENPDLTPTFRPSVRSGSDHNFLVRIIQLLPVHRKLCSDPFEGTGGN